MRERLQPAGRPRPAPCRAAEALPGWPCTTDRNQGSKAQDPPLFIDPMDGDVRHAPGTVTQRVPNGSGEARAAEIGVGRHGSGAFPGPTCRASEWPMLAKAAQFTLKRLQLIVDADQFIDAISRDLLLFRRRQSKHVHDLVDVRLHTPPAMNQIVA